MMVQERRNW